MKKIYYIWILLLFFLGTEPFSLAQAVRTAEVPELLLRIDDIGMNHSVNLALQQIAEAGLPFSTSVMFACPWYQEAVDILKKYPAVSVGVHLTLNSEWKYYRWGPVLGQTAVSSLVDKEGYFLPSSSEFLKSNYKLEEVEKELAAQIERALRTGLKIDYVDYHMTTAVSTPELRAVVEKLAKKYNLGISRYFGEQYKTMFDTPIETKKADFLKHVNNLPTAQTNLVVLHVAQSHPEMNVLQDMNNKIMSYNQQGESLVSQHRQTELNMVTTPEFKNLVGKKFKLVTYRDIIRKVGLEKMKSPVRS
jgi:predicted glycoside hydrolase/deacetylase ChbG (UPF0249 family)